MHGICVTATIPPSEIQHHLVKRVSRCRSSKFGL